MTCEPTVFQIASIRRPILLPVFHESQPSDEWPEAGVLAEGAHLWRPKIKCHHAGDYRVQRFLGKTLVHQATSTAPSNA